MHINTGEHDMNRSYLPLPKSLACTRSDVEGQCYEKRHQVSRYLLSVCAIQLICFCLGLDVNAQDNKKAVAPHDAEYYAFRDAATPPPPHSNTPIFHLSHAYPHSPPHPLSAKCPESECPWLYIKDLNFSPTFPGEKGGAPDWHKQHWDTYMYDILNYVKEGQTLDLNDKEGWRIDVDHHTRWFNVPWMAYDPTSGREYVHGTTNERTAKLSELVGPNHSPQGRRMNSESEACKEKYPWGFESWAVGYYNEYGGYVVGRAISAAGVPQMAQYLGAEIPAGLPFPEGTVVVKILTTSAPLECVPFLKGSPEWQVDRHVFNDAKGYSCERAVQVSRVVQLDVAVSDSRSPIGWVYGTFVYDGDVSGDTVWDHMVPVGLQWGSDPWTFPAVPLASSLPVQQSVFNDDVKTFQHLGCKGRLAGPVDNPNSSCTSCHASAYALPRGGMTILGTNAPPSFGFQGMCKEFSQDNANYFQNQIVPEGFPGGSFSSVVSMDTSLQLALALREFGVFNTNHRPIQCVDPNQVKPSPRRGAALAE
jgi:hypothetical protein